MATRILKRGTEADAMNVQDLAENGLKRKDALLKFMVEEKHGCYNTPEDDDNDHSQWGAQE